MENLELKLEYSLLKLALGYEKIETEITTNDNGIVKKKIKKKQIKPQKKSQKIWIKNQKKKLLNLKEYKGKTDIEMMELRKKEIEEILNK